MSTLLVLIAVLGFGALAIWAFATMKAAHLASALRLAVPIALAVLGGLMMFTGRFVLGAPVLAMAFAVFQQGRRVQRAKPSPHQKSVVRSAMVEMELDHDSGAMNGLVLAGQHQGAVLDDLDASTVVSLVEEFAQDDESLSLLQAYLDRRMPGWRDGMDADIGAGQVPPRQSGAMTHQEAYQILGLQPGATAVEIRKAHRRLMQGVHPDVGGSSFLAARINEARAVLLGDHAE